MDIEQGNYGYIKLYRKLLNDPIYKNSKVFHLWIHLLLSANHNTAKILWNGEELEILPGQVITGREKLSKNTGLSHQNIRTALAALKLTSKITIKTYSKFSIITINKWEDYQQINQQTNQQLTSNQPATNQQLTTNKNEKKEENEKKEKDTNVSKKKFVKPTLEQVKEYFAEKGTTIDPVQFWNHYEASNWYRGKTKISNWKACLNTWTKKQEKQPQNSNFVKVAGIDYESAQKQFSEWMNS